MKNYPMEVRKGAVYTLPEVAKWLRLSESTVRRWIAKSKLHGCRYGNEWRFLGADLLEFASSRKFEEWFEAVMRLPDEEADAAFSELMPTGTDKRQPG